MENFTCAVCGGSYSVDEEHSAYISICKACIMGGRKTNLVITKTNEDWQKIAEQNSIEIYERQPGESDNEWRIWQAYCSMYPSIKPSLRIAAEAANMSYSHARYASSRWDYVIRLQAYKILVDEQTAALRRDAVVDMTKRHLALAEKLQAKLEIAVDKIDAQYLKPTEINALMKTLMEIESKAHLDKTVQEARDWKPSAVTGGQKVGTTKKSDLSEILGILGAAGVLSKVGIETTTTTRMVASVDEGDE